MKTFNLIVYLFVVVLLVGVIGFAFVYFNGSNVDKCYVEYAGNKITTNITDLEIPKQSYNIFYLGGEKSILGEVIASDKYDVKVTSNPDFFEEVQVLVDGEEVLFELIDFTPVFSIAKGNGIFSLYMPKADITLKEMIEECYPTHSVEVKNDIKLWVKDCFELTVTFLDVEKEIKIMFH